MEDLKLSQVQVQEKYSRQNLVQVSQLDRLKEQLNIAK